MTMPLLTDTCSVYAACWCCAEHATTPLISARQPSGTPARRRCATHLMKVNIWTREEATTHVRAAYATWKKRTELDWKLDLGILTRAGLRVAMPPEASNRRQISAEHSKRGPRSG
jgi:hypothetical protein